MMLLEHRRQVEAATGKSVREVCDDVEHLRSLHAAANDSRRRIRSILDGPDGIADMLGFRKGGETPPAANFIYSASNRLAQKIGNVPDLAIPPHADSQTAREQAEKRERIVRAYDEGARMDLAMPQVGRWLPGYGFTPVVVTDGYDMEGTPFPLATLRDPFDAYPSSWGIQQRPDRIAFLRRIETKRLARMYPEHTKDFTAHRGAVVLGAESQWGGTRDTNSVEVAEYLDEHGTWLVVCDRQILLEFTPNPIHPMLPFTVGKRFSFNRLVGHYDHGIGLLLANAKLNLLTLINAEDSVFAPTVVAGDLARGDKWYTGRDAINFVTPGSNVQRLGNSLNPQIFQEIDRIERQFRVTVGYSVIDDAQSPNSFVTGRGMDSLQAGIDNEVREYQTSIRRMMEELDGIRLAWDEAAYPDMRKPLYGQSKDGRGTEFYRPARDIAKRYRTRRRYGLLSGLDEPSKVVQLLQIAQAGWIDDVTAMENIDGIEDVAKVHKAVQSQRAERALADALMGAAQQGDPRAVMALIEMLPASDMKETLAKFFTPQEPQMSPEEQAMAAQAGGAQMPEGPESSTTVLSRLLSSGQTMGGIQTVQTVPT